MLLTGSFIRALDDKQRLALPKSLRDGFGSLAPTVFYLAPGTDGSLAVYTEQKFSELAQQLDQATPNRRDVRAFSRLFYAQAQRVELDRQGRLRIPVDLVSLAGLNREVVLVGVRDHLEIWDRSRWEEYIAHQQQRYDEIAEKAFRSSWPEQEEEHRQGAEVRPVQPR